MMPLDAPNCTGCTSVPQGRGALLEILAELRGEGRVTALPLIAPRGPTPPLVQQGPEAPQSILAELSERIKALKSADHNGAEAIVADAIKAGLSELSVEALIRPLASPIRDG
jgi:hypothetical protein